MRANLQMGDDPKGQPRVKLLCDWVRAQTQFIAQSTGKADKECREGHVGVNALALAAAVANAKYHR